MGSWKIMAISLPRTLRSASSGAPISSRPLKRSELPAPWLGLTGFFAIAVMLSLLIFMGEAVRDALDPRKLFAGEPAPEEAASAQPGTAAEGAE